MNSPLHILICDDHPMIADGLEQLFIRQWWKIEGKYFSAAALLAHENWESAHVLVLDMHLKDGDGLEVCKQLKRSYPSLVIVGYSGVEEPAVVQSFIKAGGSGYVFKSGSSDELIQAVERCSRGEMYVHPQLALLWAKGTNVKSADAYIPQLSAREKEILRLIVDEKTTQEIATALFISVNTVETHRNHLLQKLGAKNVAGAVRIAIEKGLV